MITTSQHPAATSASPHPELELSTNAAAESVADYSFAEGERHIRMLYPENAEEILEAHWQVVK